MRLGGVAILSGAAVGVVIALAFHGASPPEPSGSASRDSAARASASSPVTAPVASASSTPPLASDPEPAATHAAPALPSMTAAVPVESASASARPPATSAEPFPVAAPLPPVTSVKELQRAEIRCYEVDPEECGRAADAYDGGQLVPRDAARAANLRKVELTRLNRRCEQRSPHACLVLAGHYESGAGVDENDKHARALVQHARELCRHGAKAECAGGEPK